MCPSFGPKWKNVKLILKLFKSSIRLVKSYCVLKPCQSRNDSQLERVQFIKDLSTASPCHSSPCRGYGALLFLPGLPTLSHSIWCATKNLIQTDKLLPIAFYSTLFQSCGCSVQQPPGTSRLCQYTAICADNNMVYKLHTKQHHVRIFP